MKVNERRILSGQIRYVDFLSGSRALQGGIRPALIIQNDTGCEHSPRIWVIPLTSKTGKAKHLPMHVVVPKTTENGLRCDSVALVEQAAFVLRETIGALVGEMESEYRANCGLALVKNCSGIFPYALSGLAS